ncbi:VWA containing CoxE family protein [Brasilonema octagenarum UFV-E1]|uniref:VWA containing CoxE family protein n=2 Tax=Brasilonema TaxID=383614 RepID=A0A856MKF9_9CYAN|nr:MULTISPECIES: VWA domain-containing protein [Brasilonema]NMF66983.1 VWA containing CoxE family protein [Brasilonema octagenarum UFV-OR1]QDL09416.1 VWA containing CoxE family protein [Brasilonema sennae CENA114]QDL15772.1 VWA containing CoxE family protein [Brasilonema octagenarum UFV-E1]
MSSFNPQDLMTRAFIRLRQSGFQLGVGEFLAARQAVEGGFGEDEEALAETLKILWCHSPSEQSQFDPIWESLQMSSTPKNPEKKPPVKEPKLESDQERVEEPQKLSSPPPQETVTEIKSKPELASLPIRAPFTPVENQDTSALQTYYPISRRSMVYGWRYLRQPIADGSLDVLDVNATIEQATRQGFYLAPVYRRRERNNAHLLLLLDQNGSMTPFHRFTRDLVETAIYESSLQPDKVSVFYFHNVPAASVYKDLYLTEPIKLQTVLETCDNQTSILIVSDAGAARGYRKLERIRATTSFLFQLKRHSSLIAWLNPMPEERWIGSSAEIIANLVPMYQMDNNGLSNAIDIVRGQPLQHLNSPFS